MGQPQGSRPLPDHSEHPLTNSGHGVVVWPYKEGVSGLMNDGPEKNTIQYASDGLNFVPKAIISNPPSQAGAYRPDAFDDTKCGKGITWGLSARYDRGFPYLVRFDCDLRSDRTLKTIQDWIQGRQYI